MDATGQPAEQSQNAPTHPVRNKLMEERDLIKIFKGEKDPGPDSHHIITVHFYDDKLGMRVDLAVPVFCEIYPERLLIVDGEQKFTVQRLLAHFLPDIALNVLPDMKTIIGCFIEKIPSVANEHLVEIIRCRTTREKWRSHVFLYVRAGTRQAFEDWDHKSMLVFNRETVQLRDKPHFPSGYSMRLTEYAYIPDARPPAPAPAPA